MVEYKFSKQKLLIIMEIGTYTIASSFGARRTHHGTSMFWSLVKSDDFAPPSLEGVHMTHTP